MRSFSQSSSVFGSRSTVPLFVWTIFTASKMLSDAGSIMKRISSLTETMDFMSPHSTCVGVAAGGGVDDLAGEQPEVSKLKVNSPTGRAKSLLQRILIGPRPHRIPSNCLKVRLRGTSQPGAEPWVHARSISLSPQPLALRDRSVSDRSHGPD